MPMSEYEEVLAATKAVLAQLDAMAEEINSRITAIKLQAAGRPLSAAETVEIELLRSALAPIGGAGDKIALTAVTQLDKTEEVKQLKRKIEHATEPLTKCIEKIQQIASFADTIAKVMGGISGVTDKLGELVKKAEG